MVPIDIWFLLFITHSTLFHKNTTCYKKLVFHTKNNRYFENNSFTVTFNVIWKKNAYTKADIIQLIITKRYN